MDILRQVHAISLQKVCKLLHKKYKEQITEYYPRPTDLKAALEVSVEGELIEEAGQYRLPTREEEDRIIGMEEVD